jgi:hypothetical protein
MSQVVNREELTAMAPVPWGTHIRDLGDGLYVVNATDNENKIIEHMNIRIRHLELARDPHPLLGEVCGGGTSG